MIGFIKRLIKDCRGNVLAIACATMPLVIGCAGLATDTIEWTLWKRQLQRAAELGSIRRCLRSLGERFDDEYSDRRVP